MWFVHSLSNWKIIIVREGLTANGKSQIFLFYIVQIY